MVILMIQYIQKIPLGIYMCVILQALIGQLHTKLLENVGKCILTRITTLIVINTSLVKVQTGLEPTPIKNSLKHILGFSIPKGYVNTYS